MPKEQNGFSPLSSSDQAIYNYLDEMLQDSEQALSDHSLPGVPENNPGPAADKPATHPLVENSYLPTAQQAHPEWAHSRFECLLFKVAGLKLAVPLVTLGAIHQIDKKLISLPGQPDWFMGILQTNTSNIKVMDTAFCVMPEKYQASYREGINYVITIHGFEWGITCHEILTSITLEPGDVKWRSNRGKRPWLAGTVIDQMCVLVDTAGLYQVIEQAE